MSEPILNEQLSAYIDGELNHGEAAELEALLERDAELRADLDALERVTGLLRQHGAVTAPEGFRDRVMALVASEPMPLVAPWWRRPFGVPVEGLAVAAAAVLVVGVSLGTGMFTAGSNAPADKSAAVADTKDAPQPVASDPAPAEEPAVASATPQPDDAAPRSTAAAAPRGGEALSKRPSRSTSPVSAPPASPSKPAEAEPTQAPPAAQASDPTEVASGDATALADDDATEVASGDASAKKGKMYPVPYRYTLTSGDPEVLAALHRLAGKYSGDVSRQGSRTRGDDGVSGTYLVQIPNTALAEFGDALRSLGQVQETADGSWYGGGPTVRVQVDLRVAAPGTDSAPKPASSGQPAQ